MKHFKTVEFPSMQGMLEYLHEDQGYMLTEIAHMTDTSLSCISLYHSGKRSNTFIDRILKIYHLYILAKKCDKKTKVAEMRYEKSKDERPCKIHYRLTSFLAKKDKKGA
jgi:hypothetical protein